MARILRKITIAPNTISMELLAPKVARKRKAGQFVILQAREQAETIADAMGVRLGAALEVTGGSSVPVPRPEGPLLARAAVAETTTPVEAGTLTVSATVSIRYRILERAP